MSVLLHSQCCWKPPLLPRQLEASPVRLIPSVHGCVMERRLQFPFPGYCPAVHAHWVPGMGRGRCAGDNTPPHSPCQPVTRLWREGPRLVARKLKLGPWDSGTMENN